VRAIEESQFLDDGVYRVKGREHDMAMNPDTVHIQRPEPNWPEVLAKYEQPSVRKALVQLLDTCIPYLALWGLMVYMIHQNYAYWMTLAVAVPAAGLFVRLFILFHDCCHGSFFTSHRANSILGHLLGIVTFTPYEKWRRSHSGHHVTVGDLDRRGTGDVWTMTVAEYVAAPWRRRLTYRLVRNPFVMFGLGPTALFLIGYRFAHKGAKKKERRSVLMTNLGIGALIAALSVTIGLRTYLMIQLPVFLMAVTAGLWLFYVQHQFEGVYWARHEAWDPMRAALEGSSYYKLPRILQWFTGNIGLHHVHHIRPGIPNYHLQQCCDDIPALQAVNAMTFRSSFTSLGLKLWDEDQQQLVGFRSVQALMQHTGGFQRSGG
jgi:omega-6 fatty acid desaturase (delta-12 desaturase)